MMTFGLLLLFLVNGAMSNASETEIRARLNQWPQDLRKKNLSGACGLFASDLIASYPGSKDRNFSDMCQQLSTIIQNKEKIFDYSDPVIEEIIVDKDMAIVRLIWTLTIYDQKTKTQEIIREKGLDVFQRQPDGLWKIRISFAYPLE